MAHLAKYTRGSVHGILSHNERNKDENGEYKNKDIDKSKTNLNYSYFDDKNAEKRLNERLKDLDVSKRSDVNVLASWVVTLPKEVKEKDQKKFFDCVNDFLKHKYGKDNIISSDVHYDETTPHLHFTFIPVVENKKKNAKHQYKVSAKELLTQTHLQRFHGELERSLIVHLGYECGILNGATTQNKSIKELKKAEIDSIKELKKAEIDKLTRIIEKEPEIKKGFFSQKETVKIPIDEYETLKKKTEEYINSQNAKYISDLLAENERLKKDKEKADKAIAEAREKADKAIAEAREKADKAIAEAREKVASEIAKKDAKIKELDQCSTTLAEQLKTQKSQNESLKARNKELTQSRGGIGF